MVVDANAETKNQNQEDSDGTNNSAESNQWEHLENNTARIRGFGKYLAGKAVQKNKKQLFDEKVVLISKNEVANRQEEEIVGSDIGPNGQAMERRGEIGDPNDGLFSGIDNVGFVREPRDLGELGDEHPSNNPFHHTNSDLVLDE